MRHIIISPGGTGSNFLYYTFGKDNLSGGMNNAFNPHQRYPHKLPGHKIIYLGGHPLSILMSAERRGFFKESHHVRNIGGNVNRYSFFKINSLEKYIDVGENLFDFGGHFMGWYESGFLDKVIDYDWSDMDGKSLGIKDAITYLQRNGYKLKNRQPIKKRQSKRWQDLEKNYRDRLERMHEKDIEIYNKHIRELIYD